MAAEVTIESLQLVVEGLTSENKNLKEVNETLKGDKETLTQENSDLKEVITNLQEKVKSQEAFVPVVHKVTIDKVDYQVLRAVRTRDKVLQPEDIVKDVKLCKQLVESGSSLIKEIKK